MQNETKFTLTLDVQKINVILAALQELPFRAVHQVIAEIDRQVSAQQNPGPAQTPPEA